jgi:hypothetical protein
VHWVTSRPRRRVGLVLGQQSDDIDCHDRAEAAGLCRRVWQVAPLQTRSGPPNVSNGGRADGRLSLVDTARIVVNFARKRRRIHSSGTPALRRASRTAGGL